MVSHNSCKNYVKNFYPPSQLMSTMGECYGILIMQIILWLLQAHYHYTIIWWNERIQ